MMKSGPKSFLTSLFGRFKNVKCFLTLLAIFLFIAVFSAVLFSPQQFGYRDIAYFYYPLFEQIQQEWEEGRIPLWDPYENLGQPLAANPTSSVFYPGKIIFFLYSLKLATYGFCFKWFILLHFILAWATMFHFMKFWTKSASSAFVASISYVFSGCLLFQYSNVVFLVGAAWFPLAIHWGAKWIQLFRFQSIRMLLGKSSKEKQITKNNPSESIQVSRQVFYLLGFSFVLTMMILGGEPQAAYFAILVLVPLAFFSSRDYNYRRSSISKDQVPQTAVSDKSHFVASSSEKSPSILKFRNRSISFIDLKTSERTINKTFKEQRKKREWFNKVQFWQCESLCLFLGKWLRQMTALVIASILTFGLSAIQILPSIEMTRYSERSLNHSPNSIWDIPAFLFHSQESMNSKQNVSPKETTNPDKKTYKENSNDSTGDFARNSTFQSKDHPKKRNLFQEIEEGLFCQNLEKGGHPRAIYQFSVPPWRLLELIWGNIGGQQFPLHSRWMTALPNERTIWSPTLYLGVFPFLLAITVMRFRRRQKRDLIPVWATWMTLFFILASFGGLGLGWIVRLGRFWAGSNENLMISNGDPVGGVYWMCVVFLPFFDSFRYPAKMMFPATFFICLLAGFGWLKIRSSFFLYRMLGLLTILSFSLFLIFYFVPLHYFEVKMNPLDSLYGIYQPQLAKMSVLRSLLKTTILLALIDFVLHWELFISFFYSFGVFVCKKNFGMTCCRLRKLRDFSKNHNVNNSEQANHFRSIFSRRFSLWLILTFLAVDIYYSNVWLLETVPQAVLDHSSIFSKVILEENSFRDKNSFADLKKNRELPSQQTSTQEPKPRQTNDLNNNPLTDSSPVSSNKLTSQNSLPDLNERINQTDRFFQRKKIPEVPIRIYRSPIWFPTKFYIKPSLNRSAERICWDKATLFPKYSYRDHIAVIDVRGTMMSADYFLFTNQLRQAESPESILAFLDVHYLVYPFYRMPDLNKAVCLKSAKRSSKLQANNYSDLYNSSNNKTLEIYEAEKTAIKSMGQEKQGFDAEIQKERLPLDADLWKIILPTSRLHIIHSNEKNQRPSKDEFAQIVHYQSDRIEMLVHLKTSADLILAEQYWKGWTATAEQIPDLNYCYSESYISTNNSVLSTFFEKFVKIGSFFTKTKKKNNFQNGSSFIIPIEPYQNILRKITLPAGDYRVVMQYRPNSFYWGSFVSFISCSIFILGGIFLFFRSRQKKFAQDH
ncbi:MAG: hypothetical protein Q4C95_11980 [Planctomycetia bacterium]|nr:hypothetical protein [Planctomycetia bacterium]